MSCRLCDGSGWIYVTDRAGNTALKACECRKRRLEADTGGGMELTEDVAAFQVDMLCGLLEFSPRPPERALVVKALRKMCSTVEQLVWLVGRAAELYTKWPGIPGLRQILCSRYRPADGIELSWSEAFPDGLPDSTESPPPLTALPEGVTASLDPGIERAVTLWSGQTGRKQWEGLPHLSPAEEMRRREFDKELEAAITAPGEREAPLPVPYDLLFQEMGAFAAEDATEGRREIALQVLERYRAETSVKSFLDCERLILGRENVTAERKRAAELAVRRLS